MRLSDASAGPARFINVTVTPIVRNTRASPTRLHAALGAARAVRSGVALLPRRPRLSAKIALWPSVPSYLVSRRNEG